MGQIVFNGQKPKYANLVAITTGTKANTILDENEIWLIDSTVDSDFSIDSKSSTGTGKYDKYIKGDGQTAAKNLPLFDLAPTHLSQLAQDDNHKTVTAQQIATWNAGGGEGAATNVDNEDLCLAIENETSVIKFKDKGYDTALYSGYGRKYLRKNIITEDILERHPLEIKGVPDVLVSESTYRAANINDAVDLIQNSETKIAARVTHAYWDLRAGEGHQAVLYDRDTTREGSAAGHWSVGYIVTPVEAGEVYKVSANFKSSTANANSGYFWAIIDNITDKNIIQCDNTSSNENIGMLAVISANNSGWLVINHISYLNPPYSVVAHTSTGESRDYNILESTDVSAPSTIYEIQYDYDLNYRKLVVGNNSVLRFCGGSIKNGYIEGRNITIIADKSQNIFGRDTEIRGRWTNREWYPKWFGAAEDGVTDDTEILQRILDLPSVINRGIVLDMYGKTYRTTYGLFIKSNTSIRGGTIKAKFPNQMQWVLKTYNYYKSKGTVYGAVNPGALASWQDNDNGYADAVNGGTIEDLTIIGEYNEHYTEVIENEGTENETVTRVADGTYTPIFGGLCIMVSNSVNTKNVRISGVGVGLGRGACLKTCDDGLNIHALFVGFAGYAINGHSIRDSYINAYCKTEESSSSTVITPYYTEYQTITTLPRSGYIYNQGGIDMTDPNNKRPFFCNVQVEYNYSLEIDNDNNPANDASENNIIDNMLIDILSEVGVVATAESCISLRHPWFETTSKCLIYAENSRVQVDAPYVYANNDYDIRATNSVITLKGTSGTFGIKCAGGENGSIKKYYLSNSRVNILDARVSPYPVDDNRFYFLSEGNYISLPMVTVSSVGATFNASSGIYYKFSEVIDDVTIVLPAMTPTSFLRTVMFYFKVGANHNITFTAADSAPVRTFGSYQLAGYATYEINCMYNGSEWIVASAEIYL